MPISVFPDANHVTFVALYPAPAKHFIDFIHVLDREGISYKVIAGDKAYEEFSNQKIHAKKLSINDLDEEEKLLLAQTIAKQSKNSKFLITEMGDPFFGLIHRELKQLAPADRRYCYYENPEAYVPGGYSEAVATILKEDVQGIIFANERLLFQPIYENPHKAINLQGKTLTAIGYYPLDDIAEYQIHRANSKYLKTQLFDQINRIDKGQKIFVYVGGANQTYYEKAFPHFLRLLSEISNESNYIFVHAQHPRAKLDGDRDVILMKDSPIFLSSWPLFQTLAIADGVFYFQTSSSPKFFLLNLPTAQIAHETYEDVLIRLNLIPSIYSRESFITFLRQATFTEHPLETKKILLEALGVSTNWEENLLNVLKPEEMK